MDRFLCTVRELIDDLGQTGLSESALMSKIAAASQAIEQTIGQFIPTVETRYFAGTGKYPQELWVPPLLAVTSITLPELSITLTTADYILKPDGRHWKNGPYSWIVINDDSTQLFYWSCEQDDTVIAGKWGLYDNPVDLGINITSANTTDTSLTVTDGSKCGPGMVLLVESEQMAVTGTGAATTTTATLNGAIDDGQEEIVLSNGALVNVDEILKVDFEQMKVYDISGNTVLVQRGWANSKRASHLTGVTVYAYRTYTVTRGANGTTAAAHAAKAAYQYRPPEDVNYLCRQMAGLMIKKMQTGYVGRAGNDELGTGFFVNEFPKNQVEAIKKNYFFGGY